MKDRLLIIDGFNNFIRSFVVNPAISAKGEPFGGCVGFLQSLQKLCRELKPKNIIIVWDGLGGSKKKRKLYSQYKEGRKVSRLNRQVQDLSDEEIKDNKTLQITRTIEYLNNFPIIQFVFDNIEADDIIARICSLREFKDYNKIIISSDKDFYQLCNKQTIVYRPSKEEIVNEKRVLKEFNIHPNNFALAKAICGDSSDNIQGVRGIGFGTLAKRISLFSKEDFLDFDSLYVFCEENKDSKLKIYKEILSNKDKIELNYRIVQLYSPNLAPITVQKMKDTINNFEPLFNQTDTTKMMIEDGITDYSWSGLFQVFRAIISDFRTSKN